MFAVEEEVERELEEEQRRAGSGGGGVLGGRVVPRRAGGAEVEVLRAAASAVEVAAEVAGAACLVAMSRAEPGKAERPQRASDLRQEERRRRREEAQAAQAQSEKEARVSEEVHWARVRAAMAAVALRKGGRRWRPSAARAVVRAERVAGGSGTGMNGSRVIHAGIEPKMVTNCRGGRKASEGAASSRVPGGSRLNGGTLGQGLVTHGRGGGGTSGNGSRGVYERRYPDRTEEPVRRDGATGPERPKTMRPDGAVCYVEGKYGGLGVKRRNVQPGEQAGRPPGRPPEG